MVQLLVDENVPSEVVRALRKAGYDVVTVEDVASPGIRNDKLAELSIRMDIIIITRDADFTRLGRPIMEKLKVIYVKLGGEPSHVAQAIRENLGECLRLLKDGNVVMIDEEGCQTI